jgi:ankyrin repeat protein
MSEHTPSPLPEAASMDWMRKRAKQRLRELRQSVPTAKLADAQFEIAKRYGFRSWRGLKAHIDSLGVECELFAAAADGNLLRLRALLDENPALMDAREEPFGGTLLHVASRSGQTAAVELLLERGLDVNARDVGDNASPLHWAAGAGHLEVVQMLTDAHGDVVGEGDDHELQVIGWATCFTLVDERRRAIADFLVSRGARHHIFSAIATGQEDGVRRIVVEDPLTLNQRMSRHDNGRLRLHFAVNSNRPELVTLLLELGADPTATDAYGASASVYAAYPHVDQSVVVALAGYGAVDLFGALVLGADETAARLIDADPRAARSSGVLHLLAKRGDARALEWLLERRLRPERSLESLGRRSRAAPSRRRARACGRREAPSQGRGRPDDSRQQARRRCDRLG